jgi:hypothetical protein
VDCLRAEQLQRHDILAASIIWYSLPALVQGLRERRQRADRRIAGEDSDHFDVVPGLRELIDHPAAGQHCVVKVRRKKNVSRRLH